METANSSPLIRKIKDHSNDLLTAKSGVRSIALQGMI
jgi:hypothetical protein